ncbi:MAG TPA: hypothetical protein PKY81_17585 [bacterium]|nr:hypothetical protein [bacterium]HPN32766.1 hypothetical protein [bacterium]
MDLIVKESFENYNIEIKTSGKNFVKEFSEANDIYEYLKDDFPIANTNLKIEVHSPTKKILVKNIIDKTLKYQKNNGITLEYIIKRNKLRKKSDEGSGSLESVRKIAGDFSTLNNANYMTAENIAVYKLYADVLVEKSDKIFSDNSFTVDDIIPVNTAKTLKEILTNLNNLIKNNYLVHKNINLITLRNYITKILMRFDSQQNQRYKPRENDLIQILKKMHKTASYSGLEKYLDLLFDSEPSEEAKIEIISNVKYSGNIAFTSKIMDYFSKTENLRIKEHIVWALQDFRSPNIYKFIKDLMTNQNESVDIRIAASIAMSNFPDPPPEINKLIAKLRSEIVHTVERKKKREIKKFPDIILVHFESGNQSEPYILKSLTNSYFKFISGEPLELKKKYSLKFKDIEVQDSFMFETEIIFSVFNEKLGVYTNRGKFLKNYIFEAEQLNYIVEGIKSGKMNIENYFLVKTEINSRIFPCRFHPDYPYSQKSGFFKEFSSQCRQIMTRNFYLDAGLNWQKIKCVECKKNYNFGKD